MLTDNITNLPTTTKKSTQYRLGVTYMASRSSRHRCQTCPRRSCCFRRPVCLRGVVNPVFSRSGFEFIAKCVGIRRIRIQKILVRKAFYRKIWATFGAVQFNQIYSKCGSGFTCRSGSISSGIGSIFRITDTLSMFYKGHCEWSKKISDKRLQ